MSCRTSASRSPRQSCNSLIRAVICSEAGASLDADLREVRDATFFTAFFTAGFARFDALTPVCFFAAIRSPRVEVVRSTVLILHRWREGRQRLR